MTRARAQRRTDRRRARKASGPVREGAPGLHGIGELLQGGRAALALVQRLFEWQPFPGSRLQAELTKSEVGPTGRHWGREPISRALYHAVFWLRLATEELRGLGALYLADERLAHPGLRVGPERGLRSGEALVLGQLCVDI
jgi:hypothetical protein